MSTLTEEDLAELEDRAKTTRPENLSPEPSPEAQGEVVLRLQRKGVSQDRIDALTAWVEETFGEENTILEGSRGQITYLIRT